MKHQEYFEKIYKEYAEASVQFLQTETEEARVKFETASKIYFEYLSLINKGNIDFNSEYISTI
jgi:hypothetical protein